jgi:hypothetical protein
MHQTLVRPVVTYDCEMWVLKKKQKTKTNGIRKEDVKKNLWTH